MINPERVTLTPTESHPSALAAVKYISRIPLERLSIYAAAFSSSAIEGNRIGEICGETLRRLQACEPVSDRYILGLAWTIKDVEEGRNEYKINVSDGK